MLCVHTGHDDHEHNDENIKINAGCLSDARVDGSHAVYLFLTLTLDLGWCRFFCHPLEFTMRYLSPHMIMSDVMG